MYESTAKCYCKLCDLEIVATAKDVDEDIAKKKAISILYTKWQDHISGIKEKEKYLIYGQHQTNKYLMGEEIELYNKQIVGYING